MKVLRGLILAACLILGTCPAFATSKKHEIAEKATFVLYGRSEARGVDHKALCTAFVYKKAEDGYYLLTEGHCFTGGAPADAKYLVASGQVVDNPDLQPVEVLNYVDDGVVDVAELHLKTAKQYPVLELDTNLAKIDDKVFYVGYPEIIGQAVYTGRVGSAPLQSIGPDSGDPCDICIGRILVQTGGGPGASGSPVISEKTGKVVGILEGHVFENGTVVVPTPLIEGYYAKAGHAVKVEPKNEQSEEEI